MAFFFPEEETTRKIYMLTFYKLEFAIVLKKEEKTEPRGKCYRLIVKIWEKEIFLLLENEYI